MASRHPITLLQRIRTCFEDEKNTTLMQEALFQLKKKMQYPVTVDYMAQSPTDEKHTNAKKAIAELTRVFHCNLELITKLSKSDELLTRLEIVTLKEFPRCLRSLADSLAEDRDSFRKLVRQIKKTPAEIVEREPHVQLVLKGMRNYASEICDTVGLLERKHTYIIDPVDMIGNTHPGIFEQNSPYYYNSSQQAFTIVADTYQDLRTRLRSFADKFESQVLGHFSRGK